MLKKYFVLVVCVIVLILSKTDMLVAHIIVADMYGNIGYVDKFTGDVTDVFNPNGVSFTDIAMDLSGNLFGIDNHTLYSIDLNNKIALIIGPLNAAVCMNSLVISDTGIAYAMATNDTNLWVIDLQSGTARSLGSTGFTAAGDLEFANGSLYLTSNNNQLVHINISVPGLSTVIGNIGYYNIYGLISENDKLYGISGTTIFEINLSSGAGSSQISNYSNRGLYTAWGATLYASTHSNYLTQTQVSQLYVSIFGRASEGEGNAYWCANQHDMVIAANTMLDTEAAQSYFGVTLNDDQMFIEFIYENTLGKTYTEDPAGVNYWVNELAGGKSKGEVVVTLINAAMDPQYTGLSSQNQFVNKVSVCNYTAERISNCPNVNDLSAFVNFISGVTHDSVTVEASKDAVDAF